MATDTENNNTMEYHKDIPDKLINQFITKNETGSISYFDQSLRTREEGHSKMETTVHFCI